MSTDWDDENANIPTMGRASDRAEALADERQEPTTSLNFPLHWTSASLTWNYLFDFAIACELLAPRPDDLVLDFAAGTCWAAEMLTRVGVRTLSLDLSVEMMRRGRARLETDSRLLLRREAWFVAARGQALPLADASVEGVLCMNALHHQPSYATALAEIHRVLKSGGRAVFSEPGSGHAGNPHSAYRMREEGILEKSVALPHIHRLAMAAGFSRMRVVPLRSSGTYVHDYSASSKDDSAADALWTETKKHGPAEHARFVLYKGEDRPADTLLPAEALTGTLAAAIDVSADELSVSAGTSIVERARVTNTGRVTWKARGRRFGGQVTLGVKVLDVGGTVLREDLGRTPIPGDVPPGASIELDIRINGALPPGRYRLRHDMVVEGVTWFEFQGSPTPTRPLVVTL